MSFNGGTGGSNLSVDTSGNLYVADEYNQVIRKISPENAVTTVIGLSNARGYRCGPAARISGEPTGRRRASFRSARSTIWIRSAGDAGTVNCSAADSGALHP